MLFLENDNITIYFMQPSVSVGRLFCTICSSNYVFSLAINVLLYFISLVATRLELQAVISTSTF